MAVEPAFRIKNMMPGMIMLWFGTEVTIPSGWHECDGTMGTPDLRGRFVMASSLSFPQGQRGGFTEHQHNFTGDGHAHDIPAGTGLMAGTDFYLTTTTDPAVGVTDMFSSLPKYHSLFYIMKL